MKLVAVCLALASPAWAGSREIEAGVENFFYRTAETPLNRGNLLDLDRSEDLLRGSLAWKESHGGARFVFRGFVERSLGGRAETRFTARQAYLQYAWGSGLQIRAGKQRIAWGSGFAWNPTNRIEPPKNPANTGLEEEGALAARLDWIPTPWAGVILVAARGDTGLGDLPFEAPVARRTTAAVRARFLVKDTDLALVYSGGRNQRTLFGLDLGRDLFGRISAHAEAAWSRGSDIAPRRDDLTFFRLATGLLFTQDTTSFAVEYFFNGEGYAGREYDAYLARLDKAPALEYAAAASIPYSGGLGLRRHYMQASWTRGEIRGEWTASLRGAVGLSDGGVALTPGLAYAPRGDLTLSLDGILLLGPGRSEYRLPPVKGALQARVKALF